MTDVYKFSVLDLLPYILLVFFLFVLVNKKFKGINTSTCICLLLIFFSAIRVGTGYDYYAYKRLILGDVESHVLERIEPLAKFVMNLSGYFHYQLFYVITSVLIIYPLYHVVKNYSKDPALSLVVYILFPIFFIESMSIIRNAVAFSLVFVSFIFYIEKKYVGAFLLFISAIGFHTSAIIGLLLLFINHFKCNNTLNWFFYAISLGLSSIVLTITLSLSSNIPGLEVISRYILNEKIGGNTMAFIVNLIGLLNLIFWNKLKSVDGRNILWLNIVNFGVVIWNIFSFEGTFRLRLSSYFLIFIIILLPSYIYISTFAYRKLIKQVICLIFFLIFCSSFFINIKSHLNTGNKMSFLPYQTIFYNVSYSLYENQ